MPRYYVMIMSEERLIGDREREFLSLYEAMRYARDLAIHFMGVTIRVLEVEEERDYSVEYRIYTDA